METTHGNFLGIKLNKKCLEFMSKLKADFGIPIKLEAVNRGLDTEYGFAKITRGIPEIELNGKTGLTPENLIHEAFHLQLRFDGCPTVGFEFNDLVPPTKNNKFWMNWLGLRLWDKILHASFYPKMRRMGLNPYSSFADEISRAIKSRRIENLNTANQKEDLALYYLQTFVETDKPDLLLKVEKFYGEEYDRDGIELGRQLVRTVKSESLDTPHGAVKAFISCFGIMMPVGLTQKDKGSRTYGEFVDKTAIFTFIPKVS